MTEEEKQQKIKKLSTFAQSPTLATFDVMNEIADSLKVIADKEEKEMPEFPAFPEIIKIDLSETNNLLQQILDKEEKEELPMDISVTLKIV